MKIPTFEDYIGAQILVKPM